MLDGTLIRVQPADAPKVFPMVSGLIDAAFAELDEPTPDYLPWLAEGKGLLWVYVRNHRIVAAATSSFIKGRDGLTCRIVACGGESEEEGVKMWRGCISEIERYAKSKGCYKMQIDGRRGWVRVLPDYDPKCVSFEKRI